MKLNKDTMKFETFVKSNDEGLMKQLKASGVHFRFANGEFFIVNDKDKSKAEKSLK